MTVAIDLVTDIDAPIQLVYDLARDLDLHARSMAHTGERAIGGRTSGRIAPRRSGRQIGRGRRTLQAAWPWRPQPVARAGSGHLLMSSRQTHLSLAKNPA